MSALEVKNLSKKYNQEVIFSNLNLTFPPGSFTSLLGPSGCGKSTFLKIIAGLEKPDQGEVVKSAFEQTSFVFQEASLLPWLTLEENVALPLNLLKKSSTNVDAILDKVHLLKYKKYYPSELSGGMKMRTSLARALIIRPQLLLMDEPFSALDENIREQLQKELYQIWQQEKMTILFVTHSISESVLLSERCLLFSKQNSGLILDQEIHFQTQEDRFNHFGLPYKTYVTHLSEKFKMIWSGET